MEVETIEERPQNLEINSNGPQAQVDESDDTIFFILCGGAGVLFIAIVLLCIKCRNKGKIQQNLNVEADMNYPQHTNENERSLQLEDMDDEQNASNRPSLGKGVVFENDSDKMKKSPYK